MKKSWRIGFYAGGLVAAVAYSAFPALSQAHGPPNALQGFTKNRGQPIQIESTTLEVRDKEKQATFIDNVRLVQGDTTLECKTLVVHYDEETQPSSTRQSRRQQGPSTSGGQQIKRLEAKGGVVVTQKDQTATGDRGIYDIKSNSVTLIGNVVVTQGQNVLRGDRLVVDMTSGVSRVESSQGSGRVQGLFNSGPREQKPPETAAPKPTRAEKPRTATTGEKTKSAPAKPPRS